MTQIRSHWRIDRPIEGGTVLDRPPQALSVRTFIPDGYEPRYAYPLVVVFHPNGWNEDQALRLVPQMSRRNFIALSIRGPQLLGVREDGELSCGWGTDESLADLVTDHLLQAVEQTRRHVHVHSERIYLLGLCEGANAAYRSAFALADQLGGLAILNGAIPKPRAGCPLFRLDRIRKLNAFIGHGIANAVIPCSQATRDQRLLYTAGSNVRFQTYPTTHRIHEHMLRDVNRWMIGRINSETDRLVKVK
jgi:phospholipase/carboxylesterase